MIFECPGSSKFKQPQPEAVRCVSCGHEAEIWSDETETACHNCKKNVSRQAGQSCPDWCKYAKICIGKVR